MRVRSFLPASSSMNGGIPNEEKENIRKKGSKADCQKRIDCRQHNGREKACLC